MDKQPERSPVTPGQMLERLIRSQIGGVTQETLAAALSVSRFTVNQIINGHRSVTAEMSVRLGHVLGTSPELWLNAQNAVDLHHAREKLVDELPKLTVLARPSANPPR